jgi:transcription elongation factor SPT5
MDGRKGRVLHVHRGIYAFLHDRKLVEDGGVFVVRARQLVSDTPKGSKQVGQGLNPERFAAPAPVINAGSNMRADGRIHRKVAITRGNHKGYSGIIKDVTGMIARVELHTNAKIVTLPIGDLKEQR